MWGPDPERFLSGHRVLLVDLPGYGAAESVASPDHLSGYSEAVARTLRDLNVDRPTIVGHSMGGYVALQLYRDHPEMFSGLVLTNTRSNPDTPEARDSRLATATRLSSPGESLDVDAVVKGLVTPATWKRRPAVVEQVREIVRSARPDRLAPTLRALAERPDLGPVLSRIRVPTLVLWGESDGLIPPAQSREMISRIDGSQGVEIPGAGHLPSLEAPEAFYGEVERFLTRIR